MDRQKENYDFRQKTLDISARHDIKLFHSANSTTRGKTPRCGKETEPIGKRNNANIKDPPRETDSNRHDDHLRKTLSTLPRRHHVRQQTRRPEPQMSAVHKKHRSASGSRIALAKGRATGSLTTGAISDGEKHESNSQLKPRSRIGAFCQPKQPRSNLDNNTI